MSDVSQPRRRWRVPVTAGLVSLLCLGGASGLVTDYVVHDGHSSVMQLLGLEAAPYGSTDTAPSPVAPGDGAVDSIAPVASYGTPFTTNYQAGEDGLPVEGMDGVDLSHISRGGGFGPDQVDWNHIAPSSVSIPQASLLIPYVPKGVTAVAANTVEMDLPVSFQAGWLNTSAPVAATAGTTVIAGHVNYVDGSWAPMSNLFNVEPGMRVTTSTATGALSSWAVRETRDVDQAELSKLFQLNDTTGSRQLILITCQPTTNANGVLEFTHNHVVVATPL